MKTRFFACLACLCLSAPLFALEPAQAATDTASQVDPVLVKHVAPGYPRELREQGLQGTAVVEIEIDARGHVVGTTVVRATHPAFGDRAQQAAAQWRFAPALESAGALRRVQVPFEFVMPEVAALAAR